MKKKTRKLSKIRFKSGAEEKFATYLREKKVFFYYEPIKYNYNVVEVRTYTPDFHVPDKDIFFEVKGFFSPADRKKMLLVKESNPNLDVRMIFQQDNRISKRSKTRYSEWCDKHGLKYHVGLNLPKEWMDEISK